MISIAYGNVAKPAKAVIANHAVECGVALREFVFDPVILTISQTLQCIFTLLLHIRDITTHDINML